MRTVLALTFVFAVAFSAAIDKTKLKQMTLPNGNQVPGGMLCGLCQQLVSTVESLAEGEEKDINKEVDAFCDSLGPLASICKTMAEGYIDQIIENIGQELPPEQVCANIGLC